VGTKFVDNIGRNGFGGGVSVSNSASASLNGRCLDKATFFSS